MGKYLEERNYVKVQEGEFWTSKQRQGHSLHHSISYRACFKPELPSFFMNQYLPKKGSVVMDPFGGRGTTALQANLEGHYAVHNDISPLSLYIAKARQRIPKFESIEKKLSKWDLNQSIQSDPREEELLAFYHPNTLKQILNLRKYIQNDQSPESNWIGLTALSRLHGHSPGFFSVYSFPQFSISPDSQRKNNQKRSIFPEFRDLKPRILKKSKKDLSDQVPEFFHQYSKQNIYLQGSSENIKHIESQTVDLIITSPPFLDKVDYEGDNWLKNWFLNFPIHSEENGPSVFSSTLDYRKFIKNSIQECSRVLKPGGRMVVEVGDVWFRGGQINLDEWIVEEATGTSLFWEKSLIQTQKFTKLSNCWNVTNNEKGTNSNRCVVFKKLNS
jgi:DNA modification methylase